MPRGSVFGSVVSVFGSQGDFQVGRKVSAAAAPPYKPTKDQQALTFDDVLPHLGGFGRYQKQVYFLLCLPVLLCAFHKLSGVFTQARVNHRCQLPYESDNVSYVLPPALANASYPWDSATGALSSCYRLDEGNQSIACEAWVYDRSRYNSSTVTEFDLVCDDQWLRAMGDSMFMLGELIGSFTFGYLADRYGRRPVFFLALVLQVVGGFLAAIAPEYISFMMARLVIGTTIPGTALVSYVIGMEMVGPEKRVFAGVVCNYFFATGYVLTFVFSYFIKEWRTLQLALTLPGLVFLSYWWFIPESARWLMMQGRTEEAKVLFLKTAKKNHVTIPEDVINRLAIPVDVSTQSKGSLLDLFRYPNLRKKTLTILFSWYVNNCAYYGLSWNTGNLGGNEYLNFVLSGLVEIPAFTILLLTLNRWGRKNLLCGSMVVGGIILLLTMAVPKDSNWMAVTLYMLGKLAVTGSYTTIYLFSVEQFPTAVRNVAMGACSTVARIGGITAPYIMLLSTYWVPLPQIAFGGMIFIGGLMALTLPETLNKQLPDTIAEGESFGKKPARKEASIVNLADVVTASEMESLKKP